ncbi:Superfamily II DNA and RNA helicase [Maridesulfovibrio ferrireducens]|uniref:Superfamily II DNA and RNA helicase n=1 Tax=Maridesulfovibrio ferrireducens TaxID=246191 RepID=A0A1G9JBI4_9BACT|nr:DEAD/DEAH box helicase [Maridesulfovibrio ferrireducens]SDL34494.1 Superfamily II DNA and RNA helicase [Maridesulfovibrio ferrireducens]
MNFESFCFDSRIASGIRATGYSAPTSVQVKAIPAVLEGCDVFGLTQSGTGKTSAFVLPILQRLITAEAPTRGPIRVLVLAPAREQVLKIHEKFISLGKQTGIRCSAVFGDGDAESGIQIKLKEISRVTVLVATPDRLLELINRAEVDLSHVDTLVVDEADTQLAMDFSVEIKSILAKLPLKRQNLMFSATLPSSVSTLSAEILHDPKIFQIANTAPVETVKHICCPVPIHLKQEFLKALLEDIEFESVLVFVRTRRWAERLAARLVKAGYNAVSLHGDLSQSKRKIVLDGFKSGEFNIMVATDLAASSLECSSITHVINYDMPDTFEIYRHRMEKAGIDGKKGVAFLFAADEDIAQVVEIGKLVEGRLSVHHLDNFDYKGAKPEPVLPEVVKKKERSKPGRAKKGNKRHIHSGKGSV